VEGKHTLVQEGSTDKRMEQLLLVVQHQAAAGDSSNLVEEAGKTP
jgi:hypothetical protein